jgi:hypothetical protein
MARIAIAATLFVLVITFTGYLIYRFMLWLCCHKCASPRVRRTTQRIAADPISPGAIIRRRFCPICHYAQKRVDWLEPDCSLSRGEWEEDLSEGAAPRAAVA